MCGMLTSDGGLIVVVRLAMAGGAQVSDLRTEIGTLKAELKNVQGKCDTAHADNAEQVKEIERLSNRTPYILCCVQAS